jgi:hypothetical protein
MRRRLGKREGISGNLFTGLIVGAFVGIVIIALVWTNYLQVPQQQGTQLSFQQLALFGGSASQHSLTNGCSGAAQLEVYAQNPTPAPVTIQSVLVYGSGVQGATVYISLTNACLTISEAGVSVPAGGDYQLVGYVNQSLAFTSVYTCVITFGNGQVLNDSVIAQS